MEPPFLPAPAALPVFVFPVPPLVKIASAVEELGTVTSWTFGSSWQPANVSRVRARAAKRGRVIDEFLPRGFEYTGAYFKLKALEPRGLWRVVKPVPGG
jgi:hypothetical protein